MLHRRRIVSAAAVLAVTGLGLIATQGAWAAGAGPHPGGHVPPVRAVVSRPSSSSGEARRTTTAATAGVPVAGAAVRSGLWIADTNGAVAAEGAAPHLRVVTGRLAQPVIDIVATPSGRGYWLLGADGSVTRHGSAGRYGSTRGRALAQPVVAMASTPRGLGYWLVGRDGSVYAFGHAGSYGSAATMRVTSPVVGIVAAPDGRGYWLVTRAGRVIGFGSARSHGSAVGRDRAAPMVAMAATPSGKGYWLLGRDGRVWGRGAATVYGSGTRTGSPAVSLVRTTDGRGYSLLFADGAVEAFGDARTIATTPVPSTGDSLVGQVVTIDPGHNGGNGADPSYINHLVPSGPGMAKACDTTGAETDAGYTEALFNFDVAGRLARALRAQGATVLLTRHSDVGVGPCVDQRAAIGNQGRSDAAVSIHADGGPAGGRGFAVLEPALFPGYNNAVVPPSDRLGTIVRNRFQQLIEPSTYDGVGGLQVRNDLGGLNLSTVPKVLIECANLRNATDAALVTSPSWRQQAAGRLASALTSFLTTTGP